MSYTRKAPTQAGDYRWKEAARAKHYELVRVVRCETARGGLLDESSGKPPDQVGGCWEGPLVVRQESEPLFSQRLVPKLVADLIAFRLDRKICASVKRRATLKERKRSLAGVLVPYQKAISKAARKAKTR